MGTFLWLAVLSLLSCVLASASNEPSLRLGTCTSIAEVESRLSRVTTAEIDDQSLRRIISYFDLDDRSSYICINYLLIIRNLKMSIRLELLRLNFIWLASMRFHLPHREIQKIRAIFQLFHHLTDFLPELHDVLHYGILPNVIKLNGIN